MGMCIVYCSLNGIVKGSLVLVGLVVVVVSAVVAQQARLPMMTALEERIQERVNVPSHIPIGNLSC